MLGVGTDHVSVSVVTSGLTGIQPTCCGQSTTGVEGVIRLCRQTVIASAMDRHCHARPKPLK